MLAAGWVVTRRLKTAVFRKEQAMRHTVRNVLPLAALLLLPFAVWAQVEKLSADERAAWLSRLSGARQQAPEALKKYLTSLENNNAPEAEKAVVNAIRVAEDLKTLAKPPEAWVHYAVPAMSELQRLPDAYPLDGRAGAPVRIIAAGDEYEPGSFVVYPFADLGKVTFTLTPFKAADGKTFPADALDLKVIKVWHQNGNAWYSYFGDTGLKLTPELLLNDEDLIKVDAKEEQNYARVTAKDGTSAYRWITPYLEIDSRYDEHHAGYRTFQPMAPGFADAKTLQPAALNAGEFKQFFLTAHVKKGTPAATYQGGIALSRDGQAIGTIPATLKVLPFDLPSPKTYFDLEKDFLTANYGYISVGLIMNENGGDRALAERQFVAVMKNLLTHNQMIHKSRETEEAAIDTEIRLKKEAGMSLDPYIGDRPRTSNPLDMANHAKVLAKYFDEKIGHHNVYLCYGDEPGASWLQNTRPVFETYQRAGFKFLIAGRHQVFYKTGYLYDWFNMASVPEDPQAPDLWNKLDHAHVAWYSAHHVGPENPSMMRRQYGLAPYLAGFSATCNYAHHCGPYNDRSVTYRPMVFAYGTHDGVIDTLGWEGYREGIDDIRYATRLKQLAKRATEAAGLELNYAGRKALQFLTAIDPISYDTGAARLEIINHILKLSDMLQTTHPRGEE